MNWRECYTGETHRIDYIELIRFMQFGYDNLLKMYISVIVYIYDTIICIKLQGLLFYLVLEKLRRTTRAPSSAQF